jgi:hypothetical protein
MMEYPRTDREIERWIFVGYRGVTTVIVIERRAPASERETRQFTAIYEASFPPEERDDTQWQLLAEGYGLGHGNPLARELVTDLG